MPIAGNWYGPHADPLKTIHKRVMMPVVHETNDIDIQTKVWNTTTNGIFRELWHDMRPVLDEVVRYQIKRFK